MGRDDREKLSEHISKTNFPFSGKTKLFDEAYPKISLLIMEVVEKDLGNIKPINTHSFTKRNFQHAVDCSNTICFRGGVQIGNLVHEMARGRVNDLTKLKICEGWEGSPKGKRKYRRCVHTFDTSVHIEYK